MVVYLASEKDCVGGDGAVQECVICFEEFAVGDEMGRLECLCKFHKVGFCALFGEMVWSLIVWNRLASGAGGIQRVRELVLRIRVGCDFVVGLGRWCLWLGGKLGCVMVSGDMFWLFWG